MKDFEDKISEAGTEFSNKYPNMIGAGLSFMIGIKSDIAKEYHTQGLYTEEEVKNIVYNAYRFGRSQEAYQTAKNIEHRETIDIWFETNKKK